MAGRGGGGQKTKTKYLNLCFFLGHAARLHFPFHSNELSVNASTEQPQLLPYPNFFFRSFWTVLGTQGHAHTGKYPTTELQFQLRPQGNTLCYTLQSDVTDTQIQRHKHTQIHTDTQSSVEDTEE